MVADSTISIIKLQDKIKNGDDDDDEAKKPKPITVSDMFGEFGFYQLSITLLAFIRYICLSMMTNTGPLIAPDVEFWCQVPDTVSSSIKIPTNITMPDFLKGKCTLDLQDRGTFQCNSWSYNKTMYGVTLTDSFNLVCDHDFYRSTFQSAISIGVMVASVIWGSCSDAHGRNFTIRVCFIISLLSGTVSYLAKSYIVYTVARAVCSFSDVGLVVSLSTIIVELLGNKYRGAICIIVYTGWSFGVMVMPWVTEYFKDYRQLMLFTIICHLCTLPWLLTVGESIRWLMMNGGIGEAKEEALRISKWNRNNDKQSLGELDKKFDLYKKKFVIIAENKKVLEEKDGNNNSKNGLSMLCRSTFGGLSKVGQLFQTRELAVATVTVIWITFNSELLYMLFTLVNSDIGSDVKLNYAIGGLMEISATVVSIVIISRVSRKLSLSTTLLSIAFIIFALAFTHEHPTASIFVLNADKLAISTLTSLVYVATTEIFPTNLRQTGFGLCGTLGSLGAVLAPFVRTELTDWLGMTNVMLIVAIFPLTTAIIIPFFLRETKDVELLDEVDDLD